MAELVADCPRCDSNSITFDVLSDIHVGTQYNWQEWHEAFCRCRQCLRGTVFLLSLRHIGVTPKNGISKTEGVSVNNFYNVETYISLKDAASIEPPEHLPDAIRAVFREGATCLSVGCYNAAATMFRLCVDMATRNLLPENDENGLNAKIRRNLGFRLPWLIDNRYLPGELRDLSTCIKEDGNDGAHEGTLKKEDAEDVLDFTEALLERLYTEPQRLRLAEERRKARRAGG